MYQEDTSSRLCSSAQELPYFFKKRHKPIVIDIQCDVDSSGVLDRNPTEPSFRESIEQFVRECQDLEETKRNSSNSESIALEAKKSNISLGQQEYFRTSNCQFDLTSSPSTSSKHSNSQTSILSQSALESKVQSNETPGKKILKKIFQKLNEERLFDKRIRQAVTVFNQRYCYEDVIEGLKCQLSIPTSPIKKTLQDSIDPRLKQQRRSTFLSKKVTRRQFRQLRPFLDQNQEDKDIEEELARIENGKYRYYSTTIASVIRKLASKVNPQRLQADKTVIVPQHPPIALSSIRHPTMVRILRERLKKREIVCVD